MTVKSSVSLRDDLHDFANGLVESGRFPSFSAVVQHAISVVRDQDADAAADRAALRELLTKRAKGPFVSADEMLKILADRRSDG